MSRLAGSKSGALIPSVSSSLLWPTLCRSFFQRTPGRYWQRSRWVELDLLVSTRAPGAEELKVYERMVRERRVDGLLVVRTCHQDQG